MSNTLFFLFFAYFIVFLSLLVFIAHALHERKKYLQKLYEEGFLNLDR